MADAQIYEELVIMLITAISLFAVANFIGSVYSFYSDSLRGRSNNVCVIKTLPKIDLLPLRSKNGKNPLPLFPNDALFASNPFLLFAELSIVPSLILLLQSNTGSRLKDIEEKYFQLETSYQYLLRNSSVPSFDPNVLDSMSSSLAKLGAKSEERFCDLERKVNANPDNKAVNSILTEINRLKQQTADNEKQLKYLSSQLRDKFQDFSSAQNLKSDELKSYFQEYVASNTINNAKYGELTSVVDDLKNRVESISLLPSASKSNSINSESDKIPQWIQSIEIAIEKLKNSAEETKAAFESDLSSRDRSLEEKLLSFVVTEIEGLKSESNAKLEDLQTVLVEKVIDKVQSLLDEVEGRLTTLNDMVSSLPLSSLNESMDKLQIDLMTLRDVFASFSEEKMKQVSELSSESNARLDGVERQISELFLLRSSLDDKFREWTQKLSEVENSISTSSEKKYSLINESVKELQSELKSLEQSFSTTTSNLEGRLRELNVTQGALLADVSSEIGNVKSDFARGLIQLNDAVKASNMDFDESLEQLDSKQNSAVEHLKAWMSQSFLNSTLKVQALNDRLNELSVQLTNTAALGESERRALDTALQAHKEEVSSLVKEIRQEYVTKIDSELLALNGSISSVLSGSESRAHAALVEVSQQVKSELLGLISTLEADTTDKIAKVEKASQSGINLLRLTTESDHKMMEGKVDFKVSGLQREVKRLKDELQNMVGELDASLESRIEDTVDRLSLLRRTKNLFKVFWQSIRNKVSAIIPTSLKKWFSRFSQPKPRPT